MKIITMVQTEDGAVHHDAADAIEHLTKEMDRIIEEFLEDLRQSFTEGTVLRHMNNLGRLKALNEERNVKIDPMLGEFYGAVTPIPCDSQPH